MPIRITIALTEPLQNLEIYDHIGGNLKIYPNAKNDLGPFLVATTGSSLRIGRLLFRHGDPDNQIERLFNVKEGLNLLPPHFTFDDFAKFVVERGQVERRPEAG